MKNGNILNNELEYPLYKEYNIKHNKEIYNLKIEIKNDNIIYFNLKKLNGQFYYAYKKEIKIIIFAEKYKLNSNDNISILKEFDNMYKEGNILIDIKEKDHINLIIQNSNKSEKNKLEILLNKEIMSIDDKFNMLYSQIYLITNENNNILYYNINKKEDDIKNKINEQDIIIKEMNDKILNQEIIIKEHEKIINKYADDIKEKNNIIKEINKKLLKHEDDIIEINRNINNISDNFIQNKKEINNNILREKENLLNKITDNYNELKRLIDDINFNLNKKIDNNIIEKELKELLKMNEISRYFLATQFKFKKEPQNLKYKFDITNTNDNYGVNDIFEVFISFKDITEYIVSPNINNYNLDIYKLENNKKITSLYGHKNRVRTVKYFIEKGTYKEYLISADANQIVIIWDISLDYNIKYKINTNYESYFSIFSCILLLPLNYYDEINNYYIDNYIIISSRNTSNEIEKSATKLYSLNNGEFIKCFKNSHIYSVFYLIIWNNKKDKNFYIIQLAEKKIIINKILEDDLYCELINEPEDSHYSGFIYNKGNNDYLFSSSFNGKIDIWDLYNKKIYQVIKLNKCNLFHIIKWNDKYIITADYKNKSFKIIDLTKNKVVGDIKGEHKKPVKCIKKIYNYNKYGESLLSVGNDNIIKFWSF